VAYTVQKGAEVGDRFRFRDVDRRHAPMITRMIERCAPIFAGVQAGYDGR
jgi:hypothetical protein